MFSSSKRTLLTVGVFGLAIWPAFMLQALLFHLLNVVGRNAAPWAVLARELAGMALPILGALLLARWIGRRLTADTLGAGTPRTRGHPLRWLWGSFAVLYALTWGLGAPAVQTALVLEELAEYKKLEPQNGAKREHWRRYPYLRMVVCVPLVPGILATYHEYQIAGLNGWGGWRVHLWYGTGVKEVASLPRWIS
jgi:hypothetical protein